MTWKAESFLKEAVRALCALLFVISFTVNLSAQSAKTGVDDIQSPRPVDRWAFKTNAVEWLLTIPNFGVEFGLSSSPYNKSTIGMEVKYNWNTYHKYNPSVIFNHFDIRPEYRHYFRQKEGNSGTAGVRESSARRPGRPVKPWRAYFIGAYADFATFSFKLSPKGIQGQAAGAGVTAGYSLPLYSYYRGAVDIEFAFSAGLAVATKDVFTHNPDGNYYVKQAAESRGWHIVPYPVVSELKVAFAWRHISIREKYLKEDPMKAKVAMVRRDIDESLQNMVTLFEAGAQGDMKTAYELNPALKRDDFLRTLRQEMDRLANQVIPNSNLTRKAAGDLVKEVQGRGRRLLRTFNRQWHRDYGSQMKRKSKRSIRNGRKAE